MNNSTINIEDRLLLYGYGVFETLRITRQGVELPHLHWQRLYEGAGVLGINAPSYEDWLNSINDYLNHQQLDRNEINRDKQQNYPYALRVTLSGGDELTGIKPQMLYHLRNIAYTQEQYTNGISLLVLFAPRNEHSILTRIKSVNYLENILAKQQVQSLGSDEGIWLNTQGELAEGTVSNIFFVSDGELHTPSLECGCLAGTRRRRVIDLAINLGINVREGRYRPAELLEADCIFMTNALMGIMPVSKVNGIPIRRDSIVLSTIQQAYWEISK